MRPAVIYRQLSFALASIGLVALLNACASVSPQPQESTQLPAACQTDCATPYAQVLGTAPGNVAAYSNCNASCVVFAPNKQNGTYTGIQWQCVEFARRWLLENKGVVYGDVDTASDIWAKIDVVTRVTDTKQFPIRAYVNGSTEGPRAGDLLIYGKEYLNTGHVAVITEVDRGAGVLKLAEQNFANRRWRGDYARQVEFIHNNGHYWVLDAYVLGWKRAEL